MVGCGVRDNLSCEFSVPQLLPQFLLAKCALKKASVKICKKSPSLAVKLCVIRCTETEYQLDV